MPPVIDTGLIDRAATCLKQGGVIAYPTEGVWGLGCDPANQTAVQRILDLKNRPIEKGLILVVDRVNRLAPFFAELPDQSTLDIGQERPLTWVMNHGGCCPDWLSGSRNTVAVRISTHPVIQALCRAAGTALVSTSANPAGADPALSSEQVRIYFDNLIDVIVEGDLGGENGASEIRDFQTGKVLREASK